MIDHDRPASFPNPPPLDTLVSEPWTLSAGEGGAALLPNLYEIFEVVVLAGCDHCPLAKVGHVQSFNLPLQDPII